MIVKCIKLYNPVHGYIDDASDRNLTINKIYIVIEMLFLENSIYLRIVDDSVNISEEKHPSQLRKIEEFEVISGIFPSLYVHTFAENSNMSSSTISLPNWAEFDHVRGKYFLDDYWNGDPKAIEIYNRDIERMLNMHRENYDVDRILEGFIAETDEDLEKIKIKKED